MTSALSIKDLIVSYNGKTVLEGIDFNAPTGKLTAIIGPNGAGKSTLIKAALGLTPKDRGEVLFFGEELKAGKTSVSYVPQRSAVDWDFPASALDIVAMGLYRKIGWFKPVGKKHKEEALEYLDRVGLIDFADRQIGQLSGGQQQRVFIARALVQQVELYIMDEPFAGVDAATENTIISVLRKMRDEGKSIICVHHDLQTAREYFDYALVINKMRFAEGPVEGALDIDNLQRAYGGKLLMVS